MKEHTMTSFRKMPILIASLISVMLLPYVFIGESYGMIWFMANAPISIIVDKSIGISKGTPILIFIVTLINSTIYSGIIYLFINVILSPFNKKRNS